jgi:hypothetical protein
MELVSIELFNFRQFEAVGGLPQRVEFAPPGAANVTVILGENATGKTAFLNALTWVLYGETTGYFGQPAGLVNWNALASASDGESVQAFGRLEFRAPFEGVSRLHTLVRSVEALAGSDPFPEETVAPLGEPTLSFSVVGQGLVTLDTNGEITDYLNQILPQGLVPYCFSGGEQLLGMTQPGYPQAIANVVDLVCGLDGLRNGERDLLGASQIFYRERRRAARVGDEGRSASLAADRAWRLCYDVAQAMRAVLQAERGVAREALEGRIRDLFTDLSPTSSQPRVSEDFGLELFSMEGDLEVTGGAGADCMLVYAFIGALFDLARTRNASWEFPLVLDSPFGSLGWYARDHLVSKLPDYAGQLILLVTEREWLGEAQNQLGERLGAEASFVFRGNDDPPGLDSSLIQQTVFPAEAG